MILGHNKKGKISIKDFSERINKFKDKVETTKHTFFRLSEKQRKIYDEKTIKDILLNQKPLQIWEQENKNYAVFYLFKENRILKIILSFYPDKVYIVTFYILNKEQVEEFKNE